MPTMKEAFWVAVISAVVYVGLRQAVKYKIPVVSKIAA